MSIKFSVGKTYSGVLPCSLHKGGVTYKAGDRLFFKVVGIHPQRYETGTVGLDVQVCDYPYLQSLIKFSPSDCIEEGGE